MDFSNSAFRTNTSSSTFSDDTMNHTQMVQACRFGWSAGPNGTDAPTSLAPAPATVRMTPSISTNVARQNRRNPCKGRLYHQLICSHRIRTDLVEDCGPNCLEPFGDLCRTPFYCKECVEFEAAKIWKGRETQHNAAYPSLDQMSKEQYEIWYDERRRLEAEFAHDCRLYEADLRTNSRPTNVCSALEMSQEEKDFAAELDTLSLSLMSSDDHSATNAQTQHRHRVSLPSDASNQLHWSLNSLTIDRGACGVEYSPSTPIQTLHPLNPEELWGRPKQRK